MSEIDLSAPALYAEGPPLDVWRRLREGGPVHWTPYGTRGFWSVVSHEVVTAALRDVSTFRSGDGNMLTVLGGSELGGGKMLAVTDGSRHRDLARAIGETLADLRSESFVTMVDRAAERLVARMRAGPCDAAAAVNDLVAEIAGRLVGLGEACWSQAQELSIASAAGDGSFGVAPPVARMRMLQLIRRNARSAHTPQHSVIGALMRREVAGEHLSAEHVLLNAFGLLLGASVTTGHVISRVMVGAALGDVPWRAWRRGRATPATLEEAVRWATPTAHFLRTAAVDVTLGGTRIRAGDAVTLWFGAANRDPAVFREPDAFVLDRSPNPHVGYGAGIHRCIGSAIARTVLRTTFDRLLAAFDGFRVVGAVEWYPSSFLTGVRRAELQAQPTSGTSAAGGSVRV